MSTRLLPLLAAAAVFASACGSTVQSGASETGPPVFVGSTATTTTLPGDKQVNPAMTTTTVAADVVKVPQEILESIHERDANLPVVDLSHADKAEMKAFFDSGQRARVRYAEMDDWPVECLPISSGGGGSLFSQPDRVPTSSESSLLDSNGEPLSPEVLRALFDILEEESGRLGAERAKACVGFTDGPQVDPGTFDQALPTPPTTTIAK